MNEQDEAKDRRGKIFAKVAVTLGLIAVAGFATCDTMKTIRARRQEQEREKAALEAAEREEKERAEKEAACTSLFEKKGGRGAERVAMRGELQKAARKYCADIYGKTFEDPDYGGEYKAGRSTFRIEGMIHCKASVKITIHALGAYGKPLGHSVVRRLGFEYDAREGSETKGWNLGKKEEGGIIEESTFTPKVKEPGFWDYVRVIAKGMGGHSSNLPRPRGKTLIPARKGFPGRGMNNRVAGGAAPRKILRRA